MLIALLIVCIVLQILDGWSTMRVLDHGGRELNGVVAWLMNKLGREHGIIVAKALAVLLGIVLVIYKQPIPLAVLDAIYVAVVINNSLTMRRMGLL